MPVTIAGLVIPDHVGACLKRALACAAAADPARALESIAAAAVSDIQQHQQQFLGSAAACALLGDIASQALAPALADSPWPGTPARPHARRLLFVVPSLTQGQAASTNLVRLVHACDPALHQVRVIVAEEFTRRSSPGFLNFPDMPSPVHGAALLEQLATRAEVSVLPTTGTYLDAARLAIALARDWAPDIAALVASPACPVQTAMCAARIAPSQVVLSIGVPLLVKGVDAVLFNNTRRRAADAPALDARAVRHDTVLTSGGDAAAGPATRPADRTALALPTGAVTLVSAATRLADRLLAGGFAEDLARFLRTHQSLCWVGIGGGDLQRLSALLTEHGVVDRTRLLGPLPDIRPAVKACDVYLNEYPEGGGNTVIEAMGCAVPVVAMDAGPRHAECIGSELVGAERITTRDAYWHRVHTLCTSPQLRADEAQRQQTRALEQLDYSVISQDCLRRVQALAAPCAEKDHPGPLQARQT